MSKKKAKAPETIALVIKRTLGYDHHITYGVVVDKELYQEAVENDMHESFLEDHLIAHDFGRGLKKAAGEPLPPAVLLELEEDQQEDSLSIEVLEENVADFPPADRGDPYLSQATPAELLAEIAARMSTLREDVVSELREIIGSTVAVEEAAK